MTIDRLCDTGRHYDCNGCGCGCHPEGRALCRHFHARAPQLMTCVTCGLPLSGHPKARGI